MSSTTDTVNHVLGIAGQAVHALEAIGEATKGLLASAPTTNEVLAVLQAITAVVDTIQQGVAGAIDAAVVEAQLALFKSSIAGNNAAADAALDAKFGAAPAAR